MIRKNALPPRDAETEQLIARYEAMKAENKSLYFDSDQLSAIAEYYAVDRQFEAAQEAISYGLNLHPESSELLVQQAYLFLDTKQLEKAKLVLHSMPDPSDYDVKLLKAEILINEEKVEEADELLATLDECAKEDLFMLLEIAYLYIETGYPEKAITWLEKGLGMFKEEEGFLAAVADCYCSVGNLEKAVYFYNKAIDQNPYSAAHWTGLAKCYFTGHTYDKAIEAADFAIAANDAYGEAYVIKAHSLFHLDNRDEAIKEYEKALDNKGLSPEFAYLFMGLAYSENDEYGPAVKYFNQSIEYIKKNDKANSQLLIDLYNNQAHCYARMEKFEKAHECCHAALKLDPKNYESLLMQGRIYLDEDEIQNYQKAVYAWDKAIMSCPEPEAWAEIGDCYFSYGLYPKARLCFEHLIEQEATVYADEINSKLAFICFAMKDHEGFEKYNSVSKKKIDLDKLLENALASDMIDEDSLCEIHSFIKEHEAHTRRAKKESE